MAEPGPGDGQEAEPDARRAAKQLAMRAKRERQTQRTQAEGINAAGLTVQ